MINTLIRFKNPFALILKNNDRSTKLTNSSSSNSVKSAPKRDTDRRRITNGYYPSEFLVFEKKADIKACRKEDDRDKKVTIDQKIISIKLKVASFEHFHFANCNFHDADGITIPVIQNITFRDCSFMNCMLGSVFYKRVKFKNCTFLECDFMNSEFVECIFEESNFTSCTAFDTIFDKTEIDPAAYLNGHCFPIRKYLAADKKLIAKEKEEWKTIEHRLAYQIYRSNSNIHHSSYSDAGLYLVKKKDYDTRKFSFSKLILGANLKLTKGLTSLARVFTIGLVVYLLSIIAFFYLKPTILFSEHIIHHNPSVENILKVSVIFISLFLSFGFTFFKASSTSAWGFLILITSLGLIWYALVLSVIVRKFYK